MLTVRVMMFGSVFIELHVTVKIGGGGTRASRSLARFPLQILARHLL